MKSLAARWRWWRIDLAGAGVCAGLALVLGLGGFWPLLTSYRTGVAERAELISQREQAARLEAGLVTLRTRVDTVHEALAHSSLHLASASTLNRHLTELSALAVDSGLRIDDIRPDRLQAGANYDTVPITLAGGGSYRTCAAFLSRLRKAMPDTSVTALDLSALAVGPGAAGRFRFDLNWYAAPKTSGE